MTHLQTFYHFGMDFLREYGANIDLEQNRVHIGGREECLTLEEVVQSFGRLTKDIAIPPQMTMTFELGIEGRLPSPSDFHFLWKWAGNIFSECSRLIHSSAKVYAVIVNNTGRHMTMKKSLSIVLDRIRQAGLKLNCKKFEFLNDGMKYLGRVITTVGLKPGMDNIKLIQGLKPPTNVKQIKTF